MYIPFLAFLFVSIFQIFGIVECENYTVNNGCSGLISPSAPFNIAGSECFDSEAFVVITAYFTGSVSSVQPTNLFRLSFTTEVSKIFALTCSTTTHECFPVALERTNETFHFIPSFVNITMEIVVHNFFIPKMNFDSAFRGPRGLQGPVGPKGIQGEIGPRGPPGKDGINGTDGEQGQQGVQGSPGLNGIDGTNGIDGDQGPQGLQGSKGDPGRDGRNGTDGSQGPQGIQGVQGIQGEKGTQGSPGKDGRNGTDGQQGIQGSPGVDGSDGQQGIQGIQGLQGTQGEQGPQGLKGDQGVQGEVGETGTRGEQGEPGDDGEALDTVYQTSVNSQLSDAKTIGVSALIVAGISIVLNIVLLIVVFIFILKKDKKGKDDESEEMEEITPTRLRKPMRSREVSAMSNVSNERYSNVLKAFGKTGSSSMMDDVPLEKRTTISTSDRYENVLKAFGKTGNSSMADNLPPKPPKTKDSIYECDGEFLGKKIKLKITEDSFCIGDEIEVGLNHVNSVRNLENDSTKFAVSTADVGGFGEGNISFKCEQPDKFEENLVKKLKEETEEKN